MTKIALPLGSDIITKEWQLPQKEYIKKQENKYSKIKYKIHYFLKKIVNVKSTNKTANIYCFNKFSRKNKICLL